MKIAIKEATGKNILHIGKLAFKGLLIFNFYCVPLKKRFDFQAACFFERNR